eukprot:GHVO01056763.1.p1 GENE.GHVO01056763.1~~GHVO01056763.1.p1  ORF type:complete len:302 (+),score=15.34 GHVO01056763.1:35-940(+)
MSRWVEAVTVESTTATETANRFVRTWVSRFGVPSRILTDEGTAFSSQLFRELSRLLGVYHVMSSPYHPQGNGIAESVVKFFRNSLGLLAKDYTELTMEEVLQLVALGHRVTPHSATNEAPAAIVFGIDPRLPSSGIGDVRFQINEDRRQVLGRLRQEIAEQLKLHEARNLPSRRISLYLRTGSQVLVRLRPHQVRQFRPHTKGAAPKFSLPTKVEKVSEDGTRVWVKNDQGEVIRVHVNDVVPYQSDDKDQDLEGEADFEHTLKKRVPDEENDTVIRLEGGYVSATAESTRYEDRVDRGGV